MNSVQIRIRESRSLAATVVCLIPAFLVLFATICPLSAQSSAADLDPVVADIVEMLAAGVDEGVILQWLDSTGRQPADIGSQGLIALSDAEASDEFVKNLLTRVDETRTESSTGTPMPAPRSVGASPGVPDSGQPQAQVAEEVVIRLRAKQAWVDEDEPDSPREPRWGVFLYLDGEFVSWTWPTLRGEPVEARRLVEPGRHELRVVLQRYEQLRAGWLYESLSVPTLIGFEVQGGLPVAIDVEMDRIWGLWRQRKDGGPLSFVIRQGDQVLAENGGTGGDPDRWHPVCEDVKANFPEGESVPKRFRNSISRCVPWGDLWTDSGGTSSRAQILQSLAEYDFQPPVR